jgi:hypothetical protein
MKLSVFLGAAAALCGAVSAVPFVTRQSLPTPDQIASLAVSLGALPDTNPNRMYYPRPSVFPAPLTHARFSPTAFGDCDGPRQPNGQIPKVPCDCPPAQDAYIKVYTHPLVTFLDKTASNPILQALTANVLAGHAVNNTGVKVTFPTGDSVQDKHGRITAGTITLQNLKAAGVGCPNVATTFAQQSINLDTCGDFFCGGSSSSSSPAATSTPAPAPATNQAPANVAPANVAGESTTTVTVRTTVTSTVTVTSDATPTAQALVASPPPASSSSSSSSAAPPASSGSTVLTRDIVNQLAPQLGSVQNNNPNSTSQSISSDPLNQSLIICFQSLAIAMDLGNPTALFPRFPATAPPTGTNSSTSC